MQDRLNQNDVTNRVNVEDPFRVRDAILGLFAARFPDAELTPLACAFDDFSEDPGLAFLAHVRELVQDVANGDFDRMDVYERKLDALEQFIADQIGKTLTQQGDAASLLARNGLYARLWSHQSGGFLGETP